MSSAAPAVHAFHHEALFYSGRSELTAACADFVRAGIDDDDRTLVMMTADKIDALRRELGDDAYGVEFEDMGEVGRNPGRIISAWHDFATDPRSAGRGLRGIGEPIWAGRSPDEICECQRHEELINLAFAGADGFKLICPYDVGELDAGLVDAALHSHPSIRLNGRTKPSGAYREIDDRHFAPLPDPPADAREIAFTSDSLIEVRASTDEFAADAGLPGERIEDFVLAVNEVAGNSIRHAGGSGTLRLWARPGAVVGEVRDSGQLQAPLAGRMRPVEPMSGGHGLWLTHQVCDLVQVRSLPDGTAVRLHMELL